MQIKELLLEQKTTLLEKWGDVVLASYAADAHRIFKAQQDRFANPIGYNVRNCLAELYDVLLGKADLEKAMPALEDLVKIRAVQEIAPADSIAFILEIKDLVANACKKAKVDCALKHWRSFEKQVDAIALKAFDLYMTSRTRLYQIRINEFERGTHVLTDGSQCASAMVRRRQKEIGDMDNNFNNEER